MLVLENMKFRPCLKKCQILILYPIIGKISGIFKGRHFHPNDTTLQVINPDPTDVAPLDEKRPFDRIPGAGYIDISFFLTPLSAQSMFSLLKYQSAIINIRVPRARIFTSSKSQKEVFVRCKSMEQMSS